MVLRRFRFSMELGTVLAGILLSFGALSSKARLRGPGGPVAARRGV